MLLEKEWCDFGHKFQDRLGHGQRESEEFSPILQQYLDAVWQLLRQFPREFEFNEKLLLTLADHQYTCRYGTFM